MTKMPSGLFVWLLAINVLVYVYGNQIMQYTSSNNTLVNDVHDMTTQATATGCCAFCSVTDHCVSCSYHTLNGSCLLSNRNPSLDIYTGETTVTGWMTFYSSKGPCEATWIQWESYCYFIQVTNKTYFESEASCIQLGGHLVDIQSQCENDFITSLVQAVIGQVRYVWIGLNDVLTEGDFRWTKNNASPTFTFFHTTEPSRRVDENCIVVQNSVWYDRECFYRYNSICKRGVYKQL